MTDKEAIEILQEEHRYCQEPCYVMNAIERAITALREKLEREQNEPLTLEQLRQMDGQPVWCQDNTVGTGIIRLVEDWATEKMEVHIWTFDEEGNPRCTNVRIMLEFGARFYRHPLKTAMQGEEV